MTLMYAKDVDDICKEIQEYLDIRFEEARTLSGF